MPQSMGLFAVASFACGIAAFFLQPLAGLLAAVLAVMFGCIGFLRSISPRIRGGFTSLVGVVLGLVALVVKVIEGALRLIF